jgi:hypothetical protein
MPEHLCRVTGRAEADDRPPGGWVEARSLRNGDTVLFADGSTGIVIGKTISPAGAGEKTEPTYNFTVADYYTYFVGEHGVWVHNTAHKRCPGVRAQVERNVAENQIVRRSSSIHDHFIAEQELAYQLKKISRDDLGFAIERIEIKSAQNYMPHMHPFELEIFPSQMEVGQSKVLEIMRHMLGGERVPPIRLGRVKGKIFISDGHHRYVAADKLRRMGYEPKYPLRAVLHDDGPPDLVSDIEAWWGGIQKARWEDVVFVDE